MLYKLCLFCFSFINSYQIHLKKRVHSKKHNILVVELPNGTLCVNEAPLVLLKAQYDIYVVMGLLYTGVQKLESVDHAVTLSVKLFTGVTQ